MRTREENIQELKRLMRQAILDKDRLGDRIFAEGRDPTPEEFVEMDMYQARHDGYAEILRIFFAPKDDGYLEELKKEWVLH